MGVNGPSEGCQWPIGGTGFVLWCGGRRLLFFVVRDVDRFLPGPDANGRQKERTVVSVLAGVAPHDLEKEEQTRFVAPRLRSGSV